MGKITLFLFLVVLVASLVLADSPPIIEEVTSQKIENDCIYYFYGIECEGCSAADEYMKQLQLRYPQLNIQYYEVYQNKENSNLLESYFAAYNVPGESKGIPAVFIPGSYFVGIDTIKGLLTERIVDNKGSSCPSLEQADVVGIIGSKAPEDVMDTITFLSVTGAALGNSLKPAAVALLLLLLVGMTLVPKREELLKKGFIFISAVYLVFFLFAAGLFSWFTNFWIGYIFHKLIAAVGIVYGVIKIKEFFTRPGKWMSPEWKAVLLSYPSIFAAGLVAGFFTFSSATTLLMSLRMLMGDDATRWIAWPLLLYYVFIFVVMLIIALLIVYFIWTDLEIRVQAKDDYKSKEKWKKHYHKVLNVGISAFILLISLIILFV